MSLVLNKDGDVFACYLFASLDPYFLETTRSSYRYSLTP